MKKLFWVVLVSAFFLLTACSGDSGSGSGGGGGGENGSTEASAGDFAGTWNGNLTLTVTGNPDDSDNGTESLVFVLAEEAGGVSGTIFEDGSISGAITSGVYNFTIISNSTNSDCVNFHVTGQGTLNSARDTLTLNAAGNVCGEGGGKLAEITGVFTKKSAKTVELIGFGPIRVGDTWVEYRYFDPAYVGMCHTFTSLSHAEFQYGDMDESVSIGFEIIGGELWFRTAEEGKSGDQKAILLQTGTDQIDVRRVWYEYGNSIVDDDDYNRYWKKMTCPHDNDTGSSAALIGTWFHAATASSSNQTLTLTDITWENYDAAWGGCIEGGTYTYTDTAITFTFDANGGCDGTPANSTIIVDYTVTATALSVYDPASGILLVDYVKQSGSSGSSGATTTDSPEIPVFTFPAPGQIISSTDYVTWDNSSSYSNVVVYAYNQACSSQWIGCMGDGCTDGWNPIENNSPSGFGSNEWNIKIISYYGEIKPWSWDNVCPTPPDLFSPSAMTSGWSSPLTFTVQ
ncbi:hypothetical protein [Desulfurivibrio alkaliphilus]|uniref:Lipoprotein n=1 Tax=Desulfurivibrio alkaliphilus (strain DSM 19089 / UNIQEM U267 / AHT2) TaxID=589865 RepID=D6Z5M0_DESAT|nr:hypothetical protein [Desulfurivibrio alkaliphilus]ADH86757.1 hypothetical protein DaAHT2_2086 [Desulfurivibrio alkaliphilus AHT 2]